MKMCSWAQLNFLWWEMRGGFNGVNSIAPNCRCTAAWEYDCCWNSTPFPSSWDGWSSWFTLKCLKSTAYSKILLAIRFQNIYSQIRNCSYRVLTEKVSCPIWMAYVVLNISTHLTMRQKPRNIFWFLRVFFLAGYISFALFCRDCCFVAAVPINLTRKIAQLHWT